MKRSTLLTIIVFLLFLSPSLLGAERVSCENLQRGPPHQEKCFEKDYQPEAQQLITQYTNLKYPPDRDIARGYRDLKEFSIEPSVSASAYLDEAIGYAKIAQIKRDYEGRVEIILPPAEKLPDHAFKLTYDKSGQQLRILYLDPTTEARTYALKYKNEPLTNVFNRFGREVTATVPFTIINTQLGIEGLELWHSLPDLQIEVKKGENVLESFRPTHLLYAPAPNDLLIKKRLDPAIQRFSVDLDLARKNPLQFDYTPAQETKFSKFKARIDNAQGIVVDTFEFGKKPESAIKIPIDKSIEPLLPTFRLVVLNDQDIVYAEYLPDLIHYAATRPAPSAIADRCRFCSDPQSANNEQCLQQECTDLGACQWFEDPRLSRRIWQSVPFVPDNGYCYAKEPPDQGPCWECPDGCNEPICRAHGKNCEFKNNQCVATDFTVTAEIAPYVEQLKKYHCDAELLSVTSKWNVQAIAKRIREYIPIVKKTTADPDEQALLLGIMAGESGGRKDAIGPQTTYGKAVGLMQFIEGSAKTTCFDPAKYHVDCPTSFRKNTQCCVCIDQCTPAERDGRLKPELAIPGALALLSQKEREVVACKEHRNKYTLTPETVKIAAIAAYNGGTEGAVCPAIGRALLRNTQSPSWNDIHAQIHPVAYHQTQCYVPKVLAFKALYKSLLSEEAPPPGTVTPGAPSPVSKPSIGGEKNIAASFDFLLYATANHDHDVFVSFTNTQGWTITTPETAKPYAWEASLRRSLQGQDYKGGTIAISNLLTQGGTGKNAITLSISNSKTGEKTFKAPLKDEDRSAIFYTGIQKRIPKEPVLSAQDLETLLNEALEGLFVTESYPITLRAPQDEYAPRDVSARNTLLLQYKDNTWKALQRTGIEEADDWRDSIVADLRFKNFKQGMLTLLSFLNTHPTLRMTGAGRPFVSYDIITISNHKRTSGKLPLFASSFAKESQDVGSIVTSYYPFALGIESKDLFVIQYKFETRKWELVQSGGYPWEQDLLTNKLGKADYHTGVGIIVDFLTTNERYSLLIGNPKETGYFSKPRANLNKVKIEKTGLVPTTE